MDNKESVKCLICGREFSNMISASHLSHSHAITREQYIEQFPGAPMFSKDYEVKSEARYEKMRERFREKKRLSSVEVNVRDLTSEVEENTSDMYKEIITKVVKNEEPVTNRKRLADDCHLYIGKDADYVPKDKLKLLNYLVFIFGNCVENNFRVRKVSLGGVLEYSVITDIAIPSLKLNIEFPISFWHNVDMTKEVRDNILIDDGWTIIEVKDKAPTVDALKLALKNSGFLEVSTTPWLKTKGLVR